MAEGGKPSLLSQLKDFDKKSLSKTITSITTEDGKKIIEYSDNDGNLKSKVTQTNFSFGYVPDLNLDLQVGEIRPGLIMASQDVAAELEILEKYRVTHVLNLATCVKNFYPQKIKYMNIDLNDVPTANALSAFDKAFDFVAEGVKAGCTLIHCNAGVSRASTFTIGYLMKTERLSFKDAFAHVKSKRKVANPNRGFVDQLKKLEEQLGITNETVDKVGTKK